jgi:hypothetical protein
MESKQGGSSLSQVWGGAGCTQMPTHQCSSVGGKGCSQVEGGAYPVLEHQPGKALRHSEEVLSPKPPAHAEQHCR